MRGFHQGPGIEILNQRPGTSMQLNLLASMTFFLAIKGRTIQVRPVTASGSAAAVADW